MALHDPDSSAAEKAIALKIGRQKKIQIIDGQQVTTKQQWYIWYTLQLPKVEVMTAEDSDDDMEDMAEEGIPMQGEDGQHYVVLEVWKGYLIVLNYNFQVRCLEGLYSSSWPQAFLCKHIS